MCHIFSFLCMFRKFSENWIFWVFCCSNSNSPVSQGLLYLACWWLESICGFSKLFLQSMYLLCVVTEVSVPLSLQSASDRTKISLNVWLRWGLKQWSPTSVPAPHWSKAANSNPNLQPQCLEDKVLLTHRGSSKFHRQHEQLPAQRHTWGWRPRNASHHHEIHWDAPKFQKCTSFFLQFSLG